MKYKFTDGSTEIVCDGCKRTLADAVEPRPNVHACSPECLHKVEEEHEDSERMKDIRRKYYTKSGKRRKEG